MPRCVTGCTVYRSQLSVFRLTLVLLIGSCFASNLFATAASSPTCSVSKSCPESAPCCSEYGDCATGTACLGGCNPLWSWSPESCAPMPMCANGNYTFSNATTRLLPIDTYNNDATAGNFTLDSGSAFVNANDELVLTLTKNGGGTRLSSTRSILYGTVSARLRTGRWDGVVSAWITMSGPRDEIDWEFPGNYTTIGQTSYYWEGNTADYVHSGNVTVTDTYNDYHDYGLIWLPDSLTWTVDGTVVRTVFKNNTLNNVTGVYEYPQTPSRFQFGLWAAGLKSESTYTIQWGGGLINWNDPDYVTNGYFSMLVSSVNVTCYGPSVTQDLAYTYGVNTTSGVPGVIFTNTSTQIYSEDATGLNVTAGATAQTMANATLGALVGQPTSSNSQLSYGSPILLLLLCLFLGLGSVSLTGGW